MVQLNSITLKRLWRLVKPFYFSDVKWKARGMLLLLAVFAISMAQINVQLSYLNRDFMTALALKEKEDFFLNLGFYLFAFFLATPVTVFYSYTEHRMALLWRQWLSRDIMKKYFSHRAYYKVTWQEGIDNPDQRIEEDIRSFTSTALSLFLIVCNSILTLFLFVRILMDISWNLLSAVLVYTLFGSIMTFLIGRKLIALNFAQLKKEADYRYKLVNIRDNAESIAFYRGDKKEYTRTRQRLKDALRNMLRIINLNRNLGFFVTLYNNLKPVIPIVIVAPLYINGEIEFGQIPQAIDAFVRVVEALSILIQHFGTISSVAAVVTRLGSFNEAIEQLHDDSISDGPIISTTEGDLIRFTSLTIMTPKRDQTLVRNLSMEISSGGLLITGSSGKGKTSILRVVAGLWNAGTGSIIRPPLEKMMFIPQRPYLVLGSLRNQLMYSVDAHGIVDSQLEDALRQVGLEAMARRVGGLDVVKDWHSFLSAGEQQQLAFARYLLANPEYVFLDESTTAVDTNTERRLYAMVQNRSQVFVSVGYPQNIARFHKRTLEVLDDGTYREEETNLEQ